MRLLATLETWSTRAIAVKRRGELHQHLLPRYRKLRISGRLRWNRAALSRRTRGAT
jgi:hypothetical protein